ncbi:MAG: hypothetical protein ACKO51_06050, partial [Alphaproteobacteria bacterium]
MQKPLSIYDRKFREAIAVLQRGDVAAAEELCLAILQRDPHHVAALHLSGLAATQAGRVEAGISRLERAAQIQPK